MVEFKAGDYEGLSEEAKVQKIRKDYDAFISARATVILRAVEKLENGENVTANEVLKI